MASFKAFCIVLWVSVVAAENQNFNDAMMDLLRKPTGLMGKKFGSKYPIFSNPNRWNGNFEIGQPIVSPAYKVPQNGFQIGQTFERLPSHSEPELPMSPAFGGQIQQSHMPNIQNFEPMQRPHHVPHRNFQNPFDVAGLSQFPESKVQPVTHTVSTIIPNQPHPGFLSNIRKFPERPQNSDIFSIQQSTPQFPQFSGFKESFLPFGEQLGLQSLPSDMSLAAATAMKMKNPPMPNFNLDSFLREQQGQQQNKGTDNKVQMEEVDHPHQEIIEIDQQRPQQQQQQQQKLQQNNPFAGIDFNAPPFKIKGFGDSGRNHQESQSFGHSNTGSMSMKGFPE